MADGAPKPPHVLSLEDAATFMGLHPNTVFDLVRTRFIRGSGHEVALADAKAFLARNADGGSTTRVDYVDEDTGPEALISALESRNVDLAEEAYHRFVREIPEARNWTASERQNFVEQAKGRFSAILAVTAKGTHFDSALQRDLEAVGQSAAWALSSLPHLLIVLRVSRDLLLQTAVRVADDKNGRLNASLAAFAGRMLPAVDQLTDAVAGGYWGATISGRDERWDRLAGIVEAISYGVYEADLDGLIQYANRGLGVMVGRSADEMHGLPISELLRATSDSQSLGALISEPATDAAPVSCTVVGAGGSPIDIEVEVAVRRTDDVVVGFGGVVRIADAGALGKATSPLVRHIEELRRSVGILVDAGQYLAERGPTMVPEQLSQAGESVRRQAERLLLVIGELDAESRRAH